MLDQLDQSRKAGKLFAGLACGIARAHQLADVAHQLIGCADGFDQIDDREAHFPEASRKVVADRYQITVYGRDDVQEAGRWWPEINTYEELVNAVTPETLVIPPDDLMEKEKTIYLLFGKQWGGEDLDDNGIGVCLIDEQISEIGYKDIAF